MLLPHSFVDNMSWIIITEICSVEATNDTSNISVYIMCYKLIEILIQCNHKKILLKQLESLDTNASHRQIRTLWNFVDWAGNDFSNLIYSVQLCLFSLQEWRRSSSYMGVDAINIGTSLNTVNSNTLYEGWFCLYMLTMFAFFTNKRKLKKKFN